MVALDEGLFFPIIELLNMNRKGTVILYREDPSYGFVSGRIRFRERFFLTESDYERLLKAESEDEFRSLLSATPYEQFKERDPLALLQRAEWENHLFLREYANSPELLKILLFPFDLHNLKLYAKGLKLKKDLSLYSSPFGYFSYPDFPPFLLQRLKKENLSDDEIEIAFFGYIYSLAEKEFPFLAQYLSLLADEKNILALLRIVRFSLPPFPFFPFGNYPEDFFLSLLSLPLSEIPERFPFPYSGIIREALPFIAEGNFGFLRLEKRLGRLILSFLRQTQSQIFGYEVLATYYLLKRQEIENLRRIYLARFFYKITHPAILQELVVR
jgi:vacuolar-type H+-ATPase subunit C/Vma6|uniref:V-type ATP synthase subunit C n=1 Tax=candidate division WOR-3 bacterium TaxID=2052148 RepID=A0A7C3YZ27_UNCW3